MEPLFLGYLLIPLGYTSALAALSASAERALERGYPERAVKLLSWARKAPFLKTYRAMCDVNMITAAFALEDFELVEEVWQGLKPQLEALRPYSGSALASYGATLIGRGRYHEAHSLLTDPVQKPKPNQLVDDISLLCNAFCKANLASALLNLGRFEEAEEHLTELKHSVGLHRVLGSLVSFLSANLAYLKGSPEECLGNLKQIEVQKLPLLYQSELTYHLAIMMARCEQPEAARSYLTRVEWETASHRKLTRLRTLAQAELALAEGNEDRALSYFEDLNSLGHIDALGFLRAASAARRLQRPDIERERLGDALRLDPESHWSEVARERLKRIETTM